MKDLLRTADLTPDDLAQLLDLAAELRAAPHAQAGRLRGRTVGLYFAKPSTRTRLSFAAAAALLGGTPQVVGPGELQLGRGETVEDTARVVSRFVAAFVVRTFADAEVAAFARAATVPVVNALTDGHHPLQSLADLLTLRDRFGGLAGLKVAYVGDGNNVAHSLVEAGALTGMHVVVATPPGYEPDPDVVALARRQAEATGGSVGLTADAGEAAEGAAALYTDVWLSMGDPDEEAGRRRADLRPYQVDAALLARAAPDAVFLHCLPAHRGEEVTAEVMDGPRSVVFDQAENRLWTAQAVLVALLDRRLAGARARGWQDGGA